MHCTSQPMKAVLGRCLSLSRQASTRRSSSGWSRNFSTQKCRPTSPSSPRLTSTTKRHATMTNYSNSNLSNSSADASTESPSDSWSGPGSAAFDYRSDTISTPTSSMLAAIGKATLKDDVFQEDTTTNTFATYMADLTGRRASLLVLSGTMGNQLALRAHLAAPPYGVLCDHRAHVLTSEAGGASFFSSALMQSVVPANGHHLTLEDVQEHAVLSDDVHACPTKVISLENTLHGGVMPLSEVRRIAEWARGHDIRVHLDGARLWDAVTAGAGTLQEYCGAVDSVSLCFSKGLGAPVGSALVGDEAFIKKVRWLRKAIGGGMRQTGILAAPARVAVEETFLGGKLKKTHENAKRVAEYWQQLGGKLQYEVETCMVWLDLKAHGITDKAFIEMGVKHGIRLLGPRLVVHYQICEEAIERLQAVMREALPKDAERVSAKL